MKKENKKSVSDKKELNEYRKIIYLAIAGNIHRILCNEVFKRYVQKCQMAKSQNFCLSR